MGLAAYGQPVHLKWMRKLLTVNSRGQFRLDAHFFRPLGKNLEECVDAAGEIVLPPLYAEGLARHFGPARAGGDALTQRESDIACSVQARFEEVVLECPHWLHLGSVRRLAIIHRRLAFGSILPLTRAADEKTNQTCQEECGPPVEAGDFHN